MLPLRETDSNSKTEENELAEVQNEQETLKEKTKTVVTKYS